MLVPTTLLAQQHFQTFSDRFAGVPGAGRGAVPLPHRRRRPRPSWPACATARSTSSSAPTACCPRTSRSRSSACWWSTRSSASASRTRSRSSSSRPSVDVLTLTATPIPRTLEMSLTGIRDLTLLNTPPGRAPADPHLRRRVRRPGRGRGHPPRAAARGPGVLRAQPGAGHRAGGRRAARARARGPHRGRPRPDGRGHASSRSSLDFWEGQFDVLVCTTIIESGIDMPTVNTLVVDRADLPRPRPAPPAARPRRALRAAGLRLPLLPAGPVADRGGLRAAQDHRRGHRAGLGLQDRHARPRDPRRRQPAGHRPVRPHRRGRLRPLLPDGHRGGRRAEGRAAARAGRDQDRAAPRRQPPGRLRRQGGACASRPTGASPRCRPTPRSTTSRPSGSTATARCPTRPRRCSTWPACGPSASAPASARSRSPRAAAAPAGSAAPSSWPASRPITLPTSKTIRLDRLYKGAVYKAEVGQLQLPIKKADTAAGTILDALGDLLPARSA